MHLLKVLLLVGCVLICFAQTSSSGSGKGVRCRDPGRIKYGTKASKRRFYRVGSKLLYRCYSGYKKENNSTPICTKTGKWNQRLPRCIPVSCGKPSNVLNGNFTGSSFTYRSRLTYTCNYGYKLVGNAHRRCKNHGKWTKKPSCKKYKCRIKGRLHIRAGRVTTTDPTHSHGSTFVFKCNKGFELVGEDTITCLEGKWSRSRPPYCKANACPNPGYPENGRRIGNDFRVGRTVQFVCQAGFKIRGSRSRTCLENKHWSGTLAVCDNGRFDCPVLGTPVSGYKIGNRYNVGSIVRFRCKMGYVLEGSSHRLCTSKGTWNGTEAKCVVEFEHLVRNVNQTALLLRQSIDSMLEHTCSGGNSTCNMTGIDVRSRAVIADLSSSRGLDVLFIFDASSSVNKTEFRSGVNFARRLVQVLRPTWKPKGTRIATIVYATEAALVFNFGDGGATSVEGVGNMLRKLVKIREKPRSVKNVPKHLRKDGILKGGTASAMALEIAEEVVFTKENSKRKRVIFFITDGMANIGGSPKRRAETLRDKYNVDIYAIGVGSHVQKTELLKIASNGIGYFIVVEKYKSLSEAVNKAVQIKFDYRPCGERSFDTRARMVGGSKVLKDTKWPWQIGIFVLKKVFGEDKLALQCGGALIKPQWVLTAAHCLRLPIDGFTIRAGDHQLPSASPDDSEKKKRRKVSYSFEHPKYDKDTFHNDIALIKLNKPFELKPTVRLICLPDNTKSLDRPSDIGTVVGWGATKAYKILPNKNDYSPDLLESEFEIQPNQICINSTSDKYKKGLDLNVTFCAGDGQGENDACAGDSGGSFMREVEQNGKFKWVSVGLVSWGEGCGMKNKHGFYTRIAPYVDWIKKTIHSN